MRFFCLNRFTCPCGATHSRLVVARAVCRACRDIESLPLASLGDFVRGRLSAFEPRRLRLGSPRGRRSAAKSPIGGACRRVFTRQALSRRTFGTLSINRSMIRFLSIRTVNQEHSPQQLRFPQYVCDAARWADAESVLCRRNGT